MIFYDLACSIYRVIEYLGCGRALKPLELVSASALTNPLFRALPTSRVLNNSIKYESILNLIQKASCGTQADFER